MPYFWVENFRELAIYTILCPRISKKYFHSLYSSYRAQCNFYPIYPVVRYTPFYPTTRNLKKRYQKNLLRRFILVLEQSESTQSRKLYKISLFFLFSCSFQFDILCLEQLRITYNSNMFFFSNDRRLKIKLIYLVQLLYQHHRLYQHQYFFFSFLFKKSKKKHFIWQARTNRKTTVQGERDHHSCMHICVAF